MSVLFRIRRSAATLARVNLALFALVWLSIVVAPCAMAMQLPTEMPGHDCPHCPPAPCAEVAAQDCNSPDLLAPLQTVDKVGAIAPPPRAYTIPLLRSIAPVQPVPDAMPPARAGPRTHLVHVQFNE